jgi:hypothetical protein
VIAWHLVVAVFNHLLNNIETISQRICRKDFHEGEDVIGRAFAEFLNNLDSKDDNEKSKDDNEKSKNDNEKSKDDNEKQYDAANYYGMTITVFREEKLNQVLYPIAIRIGELKEKKPQFLDNSIEPLEWVPEESLGWGSLGWSGDQNEMKFVHALTNKTPALTKNPIRERKVKNKVRDCE